MMDWWPDWSGETCVIVASGPSAKHVNLEPAKGKARFIAINTSWKLCPWADVLYACDLLWWRHAKGCPDFDGIKITIEKAAVREFKDVRLIKCHKPDDRLMLEPLGTVGWGGNSGFQALNLAIQFGAKKVLLVGYDMHVERGIHWHGEHPKGMHNPNRGSALRWRRAIENAYPVTTQAGVQVFNCSPLSSLLRYPKLSFEKALAA